LLQRVTLFDADGKRVGGAPLAMAQLDTLPIVVAGQTVGHVGLQPKVELVAAGEQMFLRTQGRDALLVGLAALALSALVSLVFARHLRRPVRQLVDGTRALAEGGLSARLPSGRDDEFGLIAAHFNRMAGQLEQQHRLRREWLASTSHELRTPLTVLRALIAAMQEGIRQGDPATLQRLHEQVLALSRLVDDLHRLAQHDAGQVQLALQTVQPLGVIAAVLDSRRQRLEQAGIDVELVDQTADATIAADRQRLAQLFHNLVENTLRYTDAPGRLRITLSMTSQAAAGRQWQAVFDDSAPAVAAAALPRLFEPFYRGEASRSRATGGSGLGLAICQAIAAEHQGELSAQASPLGGLRITLRLPA
jgi:two-component system sensor histidine kinase BaeS